MSGNLLAALVALTFTVYLGPKAPDSRIEAITDRGPLLELIVRCKPGTAIISYSKVEDLYCAPSGNCDVSRSKVINEACG